MTTLDILIVLVGRAGAIGRRRHTSSVCRLDRVARWKQAMCRYQAGCAPRYRVPTSTTESRAVMVRRQSFLLAGGLNGFASLAACSIRPG